MQIKKTIIAALILFASFLPIITHGQYIAHYLEKSKIKKAKNFFILK